MFLCDVLETVLWQGMRLGFVQLFIHIYDLWRGMIRHLIELVEMNRMELIAEVAHIA